MGFWLPTTITQLIQITVMPSFMIDHLETILFVVYLIPLLLPMICFSVLPELVKNTMNIIGKAKLNVIGVVAFTRGAGRTATNVIIQ
jgi:hypothetical protein